MGTNVTLTSGTTANILLNAISAPTVGNWIFKASPYTTFQIVVTGTGAVSATVTLEVSNDGVNAVSTLLGTTTVSGTTSASDGFTTSAPWKFVRASLTAISGTSAAVTVVMGV